jgi:hypothetical protein
MGHSHVPLWTTGFGTNPLVLSNGRDYILCQRKNNAYDSHSAGFPIWVVDWGIGELGNSRGVWPRPMEPLALSYGSRPKDIRYRRI